VIIPKQSLHTFLSALSYLLYEEHYDVKATLHQALLATDVSYTPVASSGDGGASSSIDINPLVKQSMTVGQGPPLRHQNK
jgi:hypothetical protein